MTARDFGQPHRRRRTTLVTLAMIAAVLALLPLVLSQHSIF